MSKSFTEANVLDEGTLMIVDSLNLAFRWKHSGAQVFANDYLATVKSLQKSYKAKHVVIACDSGSSSYRKELYPGYKGSRKEKQELQTPEEALAFEIFIKEFNKTVDLLTQYFLTFRFNKCEADDIGAYIVRTKSKYPITKIWLISTDRDWDLLIDLITSRFSYVTRKEVTYDNWSEHYDVSIEDYISYKCLIGDTGDSIPGIEGVGPKKAQELIEKYGSAYDVAEAIPINSKYKYIQNINTFGKDNILLNYQLMDLLTYCDEALGEENTKIIDQKLEEMFKDVS